MATNKTIQDVYDRARSNLNDVGARFWTDARLLPKVQNAYSWLYANIIKYTRQPFEKVVGSPYTADISITAAQVASSPDVTSLLPTDLYLPLKLEFRQSSGEDWTLVDRVSSLPSQVANLPSVPTAWEWHSRSLFLTPYATNALFRLRYLSLFPDIVDSGSEILIDNAIEALAYYTAADAYASRGQEKQAAIMLGSDGSVPGRPPTGALGFLGLILDAIIMNEQLVPRRGAAYSAGPDSNTYGGAWPVQ